MKIRWWIRGKLIASMMATLIPFLALSLFWSYRELQKCAHGSNGSSSPESRDSHAAVNPPPSSSLS